MSAQTNMQRLEGAGSRVRFEAIDCETTRSGSCNVTVRLTLNGETFRATEAGLETQQGIIKAATRAALAARLAAGGDQLHLHIIGVKAVRAFDGWVVIARLSGEAVESHRLLGAAPCETEKELPRAAVQAVLDATNRVMARPTE